MAEPSRGQPYLKVEDLHGWYGESHILQGISFRVEAGEIVTLLGRNGAGKTTTLRGIMGLLPRCQGSVTLLGKKIGNLRPFGAGSWVPIIKGVIFITCVLAFRQGLYGALQWLVVRTASYARSLGRPAER